MVLTAISSTNTHKMKIFNDFASFDLTTALGVLYY